MKRTITAVLALTLSAATLAIAPGAQAAGTGLPVIGSPAAGAVSQVADEVTFAVDFSNAPAGSYDMVVLAPNGATANEVPWVTPDNGEQVSYTYTPRAAGSYQFAVRDSGATTLASVGFTVEAAPTPPAPVVKRPSAPRSARTTVANKKVRLLWTAPAVTGGAVITGYQVKKGQTVRNLGAGARSSLFVGLKNKRLYSFDVRARNRVGFSPWSHAAGKPHKPKKKHHKPEQHSAGAHTYANCDAMHQDYPHGVGRPGAVDNGGVKDFYVSAALYNANIKSDRDKDGVACEA